MWVVKLGGSLTGDPLLPGWLRLLSHEGAGRVVVVAGGGDFAEAVRRVQAATPFHELAAHNMAVLAMAQTAYLLQAWQPAFDLVGDDEAIARTLAAGRSAMWLPWSALREVADEHSNWDNTSDSLALELAMRLGASALVLVKSCAIDAAASLDALAAEGVVDGRFLSLARRPGPAVHLLSRDQQPRMRAWLAQDASG